MLIAEGLTFHISTESNFKVNVMLLSSARVIPNIAVISTSAKTAPVADTPFEPFRIELNIANSLTFNISSSYTSNGASSAIEVIRTSRTNLTGIGAGCLHEQILYPSLYLGMSYMQHE